MARGVSIIVPSAHPEGLRPLAERYLSQGALEVLLQPSGWPAGQWRNSAARRARGDVLLHADDDVRIEPRTESGFRWFDSRPTAERFWVPRYVDETGDPWTASACATLRSLYELGSWTAAQACVIPMRAATFWGLGGYRPGHPWEDSELARRAFHAYGDPVRCPFEVHVLRPMTPGLKAWERPSMPLRTGVGGTPPLGHSSLPTGTGTRPVAPVSGRCIP